MHHPSFTALHDYQEHALRVQRAPTQLLAGHRCVRSSSWATGRGRQLAPSSLRLAGRGQPHAGTSWRGAAGGVRRRAAVGGPRLVRSSLRAVGGGGGGARAVPPGQ